MAVRVGGVGLLSFRAFGFWCRVSGFVPVRTPLDGRSPAPQPCD